MAVLPNFPVTYVATDGTNVLWSEPSHTIYPSGDVYLQTPSEKLKLATNTYLVSAPPIPITALPNRSVTMKDGWLVFPRWAENSGGPNNNLWRRAPDGTITQLTTSLGWVLAGRKDGG